MLETLRTQCTLCRRKRSKIFVNSTDKFIRFNTVLYTPVGVFQPLVVQKIIASLYVYLVNFTFIMLHRKYVGANVSAVFVNVAFSK